MGTLLPKIDDTARVIQIPHYRSSYPNNHITTTNYHIATFLPLAILKQFLRLSNIVFLFNAILQSIPLISSIGPITAVTPLVFVLVISLIRQGYEDYKRYTKDVGINGRVARVLIGDKFEDRVWSEVQVGQLIKVYNKQIVPADILLLHSSNQNALCYIETANLDGEINLKEKFIINAINKTSLSEIAQLEATITLEQPNEHLYSFEATIKLQKHETIYLSYDNLILRETVLKNTDQIIGLVVYCGHDSKMMRNQGDKLYKMSQMQRKLNKIQLSLVVILFVMCFCSSLGYYFMHQKHGLRNGNSYIPAVQFSLLFQSIIMFFTIFLLLNFLIPISLNILIEGIKTFSTIFLTYDAKMYDKQTKQGCGVLNSSILQELGLIDCILTDKTGTLTVNQMIFKQIAIEDRVYSKRQIEENIEVLKHNSQFSDFWISLIICHNVIRDEQLNEYQGSSPDEVCFVEYASSIGYSFTKRIRNHLELKVFQKKVVYQFVQMIEFNSRKRMSVIVKDINNSNQIILFTKGADNSIFSKTKKQQNLTHLSRHLDQFAKLGLRTLVFSRKVISIKCLQQYLIEKERIRVLLRQKMIGKEEGIKRYDQLVEWMQSNLCVVGGTGIEDQLQEEVPQTIERLQKASINMMMITGDKLQTAENIGYLSKLIKEDFKIYRIHANANLLNEAIQIYQETSIYSFNYSLIIQGDKIRELIDESIEFNIQHYKIIIKKAKSVIFCRSSPKQKAMITKYMKQKLNLTVLSIGDGGNDVGMIEQAHIGVGILGKQGNSACHVSDFSISKFKYLDRLVLHHGRWYYYRFSYFFVFFGLKNMTITGIIFLFQIDSAFSGLINFSLIFYLLYNSFVGVVMLVYYGLYDQDINDDLQKGLWKYLPQLYLQTKGSELFSYKRYYCWLLYGALMSLTIYYLISYSLGSVYSCNQDGYVPDLLTQKSINQSCLYFIILILNYLDVSSHTYFFQIAIFVIGSLFPAVAYFIAKNYLPLLQEQMVYTDNSNLKFWLSVLPIVSLVYLIKSGVRCYLMQFQPNTIDIYRNLKDRSDKKAMILFENYIKQGLELKESLSQVQNGKDYKIQYTEQQIAVT